MGALPRDESLGHWEEGPAAGSLVGYESVSPGVVQNKDASLVECQRRKLVGRTGLETSPKLRVLNDG